LHASLVMLAEILPALPERPRRHARQVARARPPPEEQRQAAQTSPADERLLQQPPGTGGDAGGGLGHEQAPERPEHDPPAPRGDLLAVEVLAQLDEHTWDVDTHWADVLARPAQRRGVRQLAHRLVSLEHRGEQDADRAGIRVAVSVSADLAIDRADVQAGPTAQAVERLAQGGGDLPRPPVVEQDQVKLLRALQLPRPPRAAHQRSVGGELLAGGAARQ